MIYLISMALVVFLLGLAPQSTGLRQNNYKYYLVIAGLVVALVTGLRTPYTGSPDTYRYTMAFESISKYSNFADYYNKGLVESEFIFSETGFYFCTWLLTRVFSNSQMIVVVSMLFSTWAVCRFIHKNISEPPMGLLIYVCLGLLTFNMNGMRQSIAMSVCLLAYEHAKDRKLWKFALTVLIAMQFHKTAICFAPVYLLPVLKEGKGNIFFYLCCMIAFLLSMDWFIETYNAFTGEDYAVENEASGGGVTVILIYGAVIVMALFMLETLKKKPIRIAFYGTIVGFATYLSRFFSNMIMERISYYYFYFVILLVPQLIGEMNPRERQIAKYAFSAFAIALFIYRIRGGAFSTFKFYFS